MFDTVEGFRHQCFITNQTDTDIVALELRHRQQGRAETIIRDTKACGLARLPFDDIVNNTVWMHLTTIANNLLTWAKRLSLTGTMRAATPKTIRHRLLHIAARISPRRLRLDQNWPWTNTLIEAFDQLNTPYFARWPWLVRLGWVLGSSGRALSPCHLMAWGVLPPVLSGHG